MKAIRSNGIFLKIIFQKSEFTADQYSSRVLTCKELFLIILEAELDRRSNPMWLLLVQPFTAFFDQYMIPSFSV